MTSLTHLPPNFSLYHSFRSDFCSSPLSATLTFLLYPFWIDIKDPITSTESPPKYESIYEWFAVPYFELWKIRIFQADSPHCWDVLLWVLQGQTDWHQPPANLYITAALEELSAEDGPAQSCKQAAGIWGNSNAMENLGPVSFTRKKVTASVCKFSHAAYF